MSVITTLPAMPNRVAIVYRFLQGYSDGMQADELRALLSPSALRPKSSDNDDESATTMADDVLREAKALGLVEESDDSVVRVPDQLRGLDESALRDYLERVLLHPEAAKERRQAQFPYALAWLLVQDSVKPLKFTENQRPQVEEDCPGLTDPFELTNPKRFQNLVYWARYLGYAWRFEPDAESNLVMPDPTVALERHIRVVLAERREATLFDLMALIGDRSPVMETGSARAEVEALLAVERRRPEGSVSRSTSVALLRLRRRGIIALERRSDASALKVASWPDEEPVSHVVLHG